MSEVSQVSKVTINVEILKWHPVAKVRYRAARAAKNMGELDIRRELTSTRD